VVPGGAVTGPLGRVHSIRQFQQFTGIVGSICPGTLALRSGEELSEDLIPS